MASENDSDSTDHFVVCDLCSEVQDATSHCDECLMNFCALCAESHENITSKRNHYHIVEQGVVSYDLEIELCPVDGQKMSFFCQLCHVRVCPECELNKKYHVMHQVVSLKQHVGREKEKLLEKLDDVTTKTESVSYLLADIKAMKIQIELRWLERKELIRQEFASLYETISTRQQKLLADMEKNVKQSLQRLENLHHIQEAVIADTCQLSDDCISAVQNLPREKFMNCYPEFLESIQEVEKSVARINSPEDFIPDFLQLPFSIYLEKRLLDRCLQITAFDCQKIRAKEYSCFIPFNKLTQLFTVNMLLDTPSSDEVPPSCFLRFNVELFSGGRQTKQTQEWVSPKVLKPTDIVINGNHGCNLFPGLLYVMKFHPVILCKTHTGVKSYKSKAISVALITEACDSRLSDVPSELTVSQTSTDASSHLKTEKLVNNCGVIPSGPSSKPGNSNNNRKLSARKKCSAVKRTGLNSYTNSRFLGMNPVNCREKNENIATPSKMFSFQVPCSFLDLAWPVLERNETDSQMSQHNLIHCQHRYIGGCSFEEARLMENCSWTRSHTAHTALPREQMENCSWTRSHTANTALSREQRK